MPLAPSPVLPLVLHPMMPLVLRPVMPLVLCPLTPFVLSSGMLPVPRPVVPPVVLRPVSFLASCSVLALQTVSASDGQEGDGMPRPKPDPHAGQTPAPDNCPESTPAEPVPGQKVPDWPHHHLEQVSPRIHRKNRIMNRVQHQTPTQRQENRTATPVTPRPTHQAFRQPSR